MGKPTGFLEFERELPKTRDPRERITDYKELYTTFPEKKSKEQAARCMDCGIPFCHNGCPLGNNIPEFNDAVYQSDWKLAIEILHSTNNFPEFTGRICPAPCEASCVLGINKPPVAIEHIEKTIVEKAYELGYIKPDLPNNRTGKKVAVIGSGPAGLAAAAQLNKAGHLVTVFERAEEIGGLLRFGIPDFKLEKTVVKRRVDILEKEGIVFKTNANVGVNVLVETLNAEYDAILMCGGSTVPRDLPLPGRDLKGIHFAMDFLSQQNKVVADISFKDKQIMATGKNVVVIGGGDTGSDCVGTSNRHGARSITQIEVLAKPPNSRGKNNPWPEWPMILRTSTSHEEGADREWAVLTEKFVGKDGKLKGLNLVDIKWGAKGFKKIEGSERTIPCELILIAAGFLHPQKEGMIAQLGVDLDDRGNVKTTNYATSVDGVYAAGDMRRGQSLVVWAISEGREAAREVDKYLQGVTYLESKEVSIV